MAELLAGVKIQLKSGEQVDAGDYLKGKVMVGLYFSANWCPPCRAFTPKLKRFYEAVKKSHPEFEIVFVSRDRKAEELFEYYEEHMGDWTFIPFADPIIEQLIQHLQEKAADNPDALFEEWEAFYM
uniref:Thioredoxin domain-containing protein n=1 Tax=Angiostrongylus cantonensis TaxID=6313 RepID=A0A0K0DK73_ANGCA